MHKSSIGHHGNLTSQNTLIDGHWVLKLTKFGLNTLKEKEEVRVRTVLNVFNTHCSLYCLDKLFDFKSKNSTLPTCNKFYNFL